VTDAPGPAPGGPVEGAPPAYRAPQAEALLRQAIEIVENARPMPLSASSMINKDEVVALLQAAVQGLPEELRAARWLLKEREDFLGKVQVEGDQIVDRARAQAEQMVQRTEVVKAADERARRLLADAEDSARRLRLETEDWCDRRLGGMEVVLERTLRTVASGRARLQGAVEKHTDTAEPAEPDAGAVPDEVFDQDEG
jgi:cell division septum initiation protein DivIVA